MQRPGHLELLDRYQKEIERFPSRPFLECNQLFEVLSATANHKCSDPRDKIFALLSLFKGPIPKALEADYHRSLNDVYASASRYLLGWGSGRVLEAARGLSGDPGLPTWAIDRRCFHKSLVEATQEYGWGGDKHVSARVARASLDLAIMCPHILDLLVIGASKFWVSV